MSADATSRRFALWTGGALAVVLAGALVVCWSWDVTIGRVGVEVSFAGLVVQAIALVAGVIALRFAPHAKARGLLVAQGAICLAAHGPIAIAWIGLLLVWWTLLGRAGAGAARFAIAVVLTALFGALAPAHGLVFSLLFGMRLAIFGYDRWQNRDTKVTAGDFLCYVMPAPLIVIVPYLAIIPLFDRYNARLAFELTREKLELVASQLALAGAAAAAYALTSQWQPSGIAAVYWSLLRAILELAAIAYLALPLLVLHGLVERSPLDRPLLATRISELWRRFGSHLRDALVFLFYTPALLRLRRWNRYAAIALATAWTLIVGNTLLHVAVRYAYLPDGWDRTWHALLGNGVLAVALALDLCHQEWRRDLPAPRSTWRTIAGWVITLTVTAFALRV